MRDTTLTIAVRLMMVLASALSSIVTARYLGPEGRGLFFFWSTVSMLIVQFGNFGLHASNIYLHAKRSVSIEILASNSLLAALVGGIALSGVAVGILQFNGHPGAHEPIIIGSVAMLSVGGLYTLLSSNLLVAAGRLTEFNLLELANRAIVLGAMLAAILVYENVLLVLLATGIATFSTAAVVMWRLMKGIRFRIPDAAVFQQGLGYGLRAYLAACLATLLARLNAFWLEPAISPAAYGSWSIAVQMLDMMLLVPSSIGLVLLPRIMRSDVPMDLIRPNLLATLACMAVLLLGFVLIGEDVIVLLYGESFRSAYALALWGAPGVVFLSLITILSQYLASIGIPWVLLGIWSLSIALHVTITKMLIPAYGAAGAMFGQSIGYLCALLLIVILSAINHKRM